MFVVVQDSAEMPARGLIQRDFNTTWRKYDLNFAVAWVDEAFVADIKYALAFL